MFTIQMQLYMTKRLYIIEDLIKYVPVKKASGPDKMGHKLLRKPCIFYRPSSVLTVQRVKCISIRVEKESTIPLFKI